MLDYSLLEQGLKQSFETEGYIVSDIKQQGDEFRLLVRQTTDKGSTGVELYVLKNMEQLFYTAQIMLKKHLERFKSFTSNEQDEFRDQLKSLLNDSKIDEFDFNEEEGNFGIVIRNILALPYESPSELAPPFDNINETGNAILVFIKKKFE